MTQRLARRDDEAGWQHPPKASKHQLSKGDKEKQQDQLGSLFICFYFMCMGVSLAGMCAANI